MKKAEVVRKEVSLNCPWMIHYTLLYRGREYIETLQGEHRDRYEVGDIIEVDTFRDNRGNLSFTLKGIQVPGASLPYPENLVRDLFCEYTGGINESMENALTAVLSDLTPRQRHFINLIYELGFSYEELGEIMELSSQEAREYISSVLASMRNRLQVVSDAFRTIEVSVDEVIK